jgi:hypothetical protein
MLSPVFFMTQISFGISGITKVLTNNTFASKDLDYYAIGQKEIKPYTSLVVTMIILITKHCGGISYSKKTS